MARYVVALYLGSHSDTRAVIQIRRDSDERAILYAQNWLHKNRLSGLSYGLAYDRWSVTRLDDHGDPVDVATGVDEIRVPTPAERAARKASRETKLKATGLITSRRAPSPAKRVTVQSRPMSRLAQAVAMAKQKVAQNGDVSPMGRNPNSQI